jgi:NADH:ubiquinone oxidoreductase subunit 3 (subunit A)
MHNLLNMISESTHKKQKFIFNREHFVKYMILFIVVSISTLVIPTCGVLKRHAISVGFIAASTFAIIDTIYPNNVYINTYSH